MLSVAQWGSTRSLERPACFVSEVCVCVCVLLFSVAIAYCNTESLTLNLIRDTQHDDWTTAKSPSLSFYSSHSWFFFISLLYFTLIIYLSSFSFLFMLISSRLLPSLLIYWYESQMNSINKTSKYKKKLTREIINKQIKKKHKPFDFPSVSLLCLPISIVFHLLSYLLSLFPSLPILNHLHIVLSFYLII